MRPLAVRVAIALVTGCSLGACGSTGNHALPGPDDAGDDASLDSSDLGEGEAAVPGDDAGEASLVGDGSSTSSCVPEASLIYVATEERELYSYDPVHNSFNLLWGIDCANGIYVNSMAVDRSANAWINYGDGSVWKVDTKKGGCTATTFKAAQGGVVLFGMGFSAKAPGSSAETLFIDDLAGGGLGYIDLSTMTLQRFGPFAGTLAGTSAELTGTGDARLFGFFAGSPLTDAGTASVVQIDPSSEGAVTTYALPTVDTGSDWAFSFWGGDFYLYTANKYDMNDPYTTVSRYRPSDGSLTTVAQNIGFRIVGAGSSTCAPTTPAQ